MHPCVGAFQCDEAESSMSNKLQCAKYSRLRDDEKRDVAQKLPAGKSPTGISTSQPGLFCIA